MAPPARSAPRVNGTTAAAQWAERARCDTALLGDVHTRDALVDDDLHTNVLRHGNSPWVHRHDQAGMQKVPVVLMLCLCVSATASVPLYFFASLALAVVYGKTRDDSCPDLNTIALVQIAGWAPVVAFVAVAYACAGVLLFGADNQLRESVLYRCHQKQRRCLAPYAQYKAQFLLYVACAWLLASSGWCAYRRDHLTDPPHCTDRTSSSLWRASYAALFSGFWLGALGLCQTALYASLPEFERRRADDDDERARDANRDIDVAFAREQAVNRTHVLFTGGTGWGHQAAVLGLVAHVIACTDGTLRCDPPAPYLGVGAGVGAARVASALLTATQSTRRPGALPARGANVAPAAAIAAAADGLTASASGAVSARTDDVSVGAVRITIAPSPTHARSGGGGAGGGSGRWAGLSHDLLVLVQRFGGARTALRLRTVCRVWRAATTPRALLHALWADATGGARMSSAVAAAAEDPPRASALLRALTALSPGSGAHEAVSVSVWLHGQPVQLTALDFTGRHRTAAARPVHDLQVLVVSLPQLLAYHSADWLQQQRRRVRDARVPLEPNVQHVLFGSMQLQYHAPRLHADARALVWLTHAAAFRARVDPNTDAAHACRRHFAMRTHLSPADIAAAGDGDGAQRWSDRALAALRESLRPVAFAVWVDDASAAAAPAAVGDVKAEAGVLLPAAAVPAAVHPECVWLARQPANASVASRVHAFAAFCNVWTRTHVDAFRPPWP